jgi:hypothetical protein
MSHVDIEEQRMWAHWYERARQAYEKERQRRGGKKIDWRELPLIPPPKKSDVHRN